MFPSGSANQGKFPGRYLDRRHQNLFAESHGFIEGGLEVLYLHIDSHVIVWLVAE